MCCPAFEDESRGRMYAEIGFFLADFFPES